MLSNLLGEKLVYKILFVLYSALAIGITFNKIVLSLATMLLFLLVLLDFNFRKYKESIQKNKVIQLLILFLIVHLVSFFWSENTSYFLKDINVKLSFYAIPLIFVLKPIQQKKHIFIIFGLFLLSLTIISLINFISYYGWRKTAYDDIRSLSLFSSHIRFGLMVIFGIVLCVFWVKSKELKLKFISVILISWFSVYTYFSEVFSAYLALFGMILVILIYQSIYGNKKRVYQFLLTFFILFNTSAVTWFYIKIKESDKIPKLSELKKYTAEGNLYEHELSSKYFINGNHVYSNFCGVELIREWSKTSKISLIDSNNIRNNHFYILVQYMASKGLMKDAEGFKSLNHQDILKIEKGISNFQDEKEGFISRMKTLQNEFRDNDPNGKTILQRVEYLETGFKIFENNWFFGIGSGDLQDQFDHYYITTNSKLKPKNRLRCHNQIMTYFISFGVIGGILFLVIFYVAIRLFLKQKSLLAILFTTIILISFLSEDTLETQMGATFFALFFGLFISSGGLLKKTIKY